MCVKIKVELAKYRDSIIYITKLKQIQIVIFLIYFLYFLAFHVSHAKSTYMKEKEKKKKC